MVVCIDKNHFIPFSITLTFQLSICLFYHPLIPVTLAHFYSLSPNYLPPLHQRKCKHFLSLTHTNGSSACQIHSQHFEGEKELRNGDNARKDLLLLAGWGWGEETIQSLKNWSSEPIFFVYGPHLISILLRRWDPHSHLMSKISYHIIMIKYLELYENLFKHCVL